MPILVEFFPFINKSERTLVRAVTIFVDLFTCFSKCISILYNITTDLMAANADF